MNRTFLSILVAGGMFLLPQLQAQCDTTSLSGAYGFHAFGFSNGIFTSAGRFVADGAGKLSSINLNISVTGAVTLEQNNTGSYTVNPDCTGTLTLKSATLSSVNLEFVLVNGNSELLLSGGDPGTGVYGTARTASSGTCSVSSLSGAYGFHFGGLGPTFAYVTETGRLVANGAGGLSIVDSNSASGAITRSETNSGYYTVNPNCTGTLVLKSGTNPIVNYYFVLVNGTSELYITNTDQGSAVYGSANKQ